MKISSKLLIFTGFLGIAPLYLSGQQNVKINKAEFRKDDDAGLKEAWKSINEGDKLFKAGKGTFREARDYYLIANNYNGENPELNYKIGVCYLYSDDKFESINYLRKAFLLDKNVSTDIRLMLARAYHLTLEFDKAIEEYENYKKSLNRKKISEETPRINRLIEECQNGKILVAKPLRVIITNMGGNINSVADDYNSIFTSDDSTMFFTSRRQQNKKAKRSAYDNKFFEDIYVSYKVNEVWDTAANLGKPVNVKKHNTAAVAISPDGKQLYIYRGDKDGGDIYYAKWKKGKWTSPKSLPSKFNTKYRETSMSLSGDQQYMYFVSSNPKESIGGRDIFVSFKDERGKWTKPASMGDKINTADDEEGVYVTPDGNSLYFSSTGHNSMGGYDVFKTVKNELGEWTDPVNLGYPINTPDDDIFYSIAPAGNYAYYSANRMGGLGRRDIYKIVFLGTEKEMVMSTEDILIAGIQDQQKTGFFTPPSEISIDTSYVLVGKVYNLNTNAGVMAKLEFIDVDRSQVIATAMSGDTGAYRARLPMGKAYGVEITARDYLFFLDIVDISGESSDVEITRNFGLEKVEVGKTVVLENIFFETNKATLKPESEAQLEQVLKFMDSNPTMRMEISGHTDNVGSLKVNTNLSQARAESVVKWLVERGIDASRLDAKGYAFSQPIAPNDTPEGRAKNRRVEFKVLSM